MMISALQIGDELQARALAKMAWDHRLDEMGGAAWVDGVLQLYGDASPDNDRLITNLLTFGGYASKIDRFRDKLQTEIPQPSDLPGDLGRLAEDDTPATSNPMGMQFGTAG